MILKHKRLLQVWGANGGILPSPYLVAGWKLDGNALDMSGNGHHGTEYNITYGAGKYGLGAVLNGTSSYIEMASTVIPNYTTTFTVCFWANFTNKISSSVFGSIDSNMYSGIAAVLPTRMWCQSIRRRFRADGIGMIPDGLNHYAVIFNASELSMSFYRNGIFILTTTTTTTDDPLGWGTKTIIGANRNAELSLVRFFYGTISSAYIFSCALSSADIARVMNNENPTYA